MTPFVITANGRDGSRLIERSLHAHPDVFCLPELLNQRRSEDHHAEGSAAAFLDGVLYGRADLGRYAAVGFRMLFHQGRRPPIDDARDHLRSLGVKVIHVRRRDLLRQYVSRLIAERTGMWFDQTGESPSTLTVRVEPDEALAFFEKSKLAYEQSREEFAEHDSFEVVYEDLDVDFEGEMSGLFAFLSVEPRSVVPDVHRQEHRSIPEVVSNWKDVGPLLNSEDTSHHCDAPSRTLARPNSVTICDRSASRRAS